MAQMRRPLLLGLLAAAAGWQPPRVRPRALLRLRAEAPRGAVMRKLDNLFAPRNAYTVEKGDASHYAVLGVSNRATDAELKRAYRVLSKTCHPDVDPSPAGRTRFDAVALAYETLRDAKKRDAYDGALRVEALAAGAEAWIDGFAAPFLSGAAERVAEITENVTLAQAAAAAAGFVVAGPVGAAAGVAAQKVYAENLEEEAAAKAPRKPAAAKAPRTPAAGRPANATTEPARPPVAGTAPAAPAPVTTATNATTAPAPEPRRRGQTWGPAAAGAVGFVVAGPIGAAAGVAAERLSRRNSSVDVLYAAPGAAPPTAASPIPPAPAPAAATLPPPTGARKKARSAAEAGDGLARMTRSELRRTLLRRGVKATGSKAVLIERIRGLPPEGEAKTQ